MMTTTEATMTTKAMTDHFVSGDNDGVDDETMSTMTTTMVATITTRALTTFLCL